MNNANTTTTGNGKQPKALLVDVDFRRSGMASIARSEDDIKKMFGYKPIHVKTGPGFKKLMEAIGTSVDIELEYGFDSQFKLNPKFADLDFLVFDTLSGLQSFVVTEVQGAKSSVVLQDWGRIGTTMTKYLTQICNSTCNIIAFSHSKYIEDKELGRRVESPALAGQTGEQLGKYFDNVIFSDIQTDKVGKRTYRWQIAPSERRDCRCLPSVTEAALKNGGFLEQDFVKLYELIKQDTVEATKTLIIGRVGSGKTYSLRSLVNVKV